MKKIRILLFFVLMICLLPMFYACTSKAKLSTPKNVSINSDTFVLSWNKVENADYYGVEINGKVYQTTNTTFLFEEYVLESGVYDIRVGAFSQSAQIQHSNFSSSKILDLRKKLSAPSIKFDSETGKLFWNEVNGAYYYKLNVNGIAILTTESSFNLYDYSNGLNNYLHRGTNNSFSVFCPATSNFLASECSREVNIFIASNQDTPKNLQITKSNGQYILSFDAVSTANSYIVSVNEKSIETQSNQINVSMLLNGFGKYDITVKANQVYGNDGNIKYMASSNSEVLKYEKTPDFVGKPIQNIQISSQKVLTFDALQDVAIYQITVDEEFFETTNCEYDLSNVLSDGKNYHISIVAKDGTYQSEASNITYKNLIKLQTPTFEFVEPETSRAKTRHINIITDYAVVYVSFRIYFDGDFIETRNQTNIDITNNLKLGQNQIKVIAMTDDEYYQNSDQSTLDYEYYYDIELEEIATANVVAEEGKYFLTFSEVEGVNRYIVSINNGEEIEVTQNDFDDNINLYKIDIDTEISQTGEYQIIITPKPAEDCLKTNDKILIQNLKTYKIEDYQSQKFFYNGKDYTYAVENEFALGEAVLYAILYRLDSIEIYVNYNYAGIDNAYTSDTCAIQRLLPVVNNIGVDSTSGNDIMSQIIVNALRDMPKVMGLIERAHDQLYLYVTASSHLTSQKSNRVYTIDFDYSNAGKYQADESHSSVDADYVGQRTNQVFPIDSYQPVPVETVSQLLMAVQFGRKPEFVNQDSSDLNHLAEETYYSARYILSQICSQGMSDYEIIKAIHDWIVLNNTYDNTTYQRATGTPFTSDNLSDMAFFASGTVLKNLSVCTGYAQTFSLMCGIMGIETRVCFGLVDDNINWSNIDFTNMFSLFPLMSASIGAHSWNRVYISTPNNSQKAWYIVDCTWDDPDSAQKISYNYFMKTDSDISSTRKELYPYGTYYHETDIDGNQIDFSATTSM